MNIYPILEYMKPLWAFFAIIASFWIPLILLSIFKCRQETSLKFSRMASACDRKHKNKQADLDIEFWKSELASRPNSITTK